MNQKQKDFKHLSYEERVIIECLYNSGSSVRYIASILERSSNTVSYELHQNTVIGIYEAKKAEQKARLRRYRSKRDCLKVSSDSQLHAFVDDHLRLRWSPERISGYLKIQQNTVCSGKAIYKYAKSRCLERFLMHKGTKQNKSYYKQVSYLRGDRKYIDQRELTNELGHYELDFIVSSKSSYVLLVCVDKISKYTRILVLANRKHSTIVSAFYELFSNQILLSITTDNDIAFTNWKQLEKIFKTTIYFTHPYCSYEKGLVENTNRWIREYIPKKYDLSLVTTRQLADSLYFLNDIPRQILGFRTATEVYYGEHSEYSIEKSAVS
jgi:transposase, IS30 family